MKPFFSGYLLRSVLSEWERPMLMGAAMVTYLQNPLEMQVFGID